MYSESYQVIKLSSYQVIFFIFFWFLLTMRQSPKKIKVMPHNPRSTATPCKMNPTATPKGPEARKKLKYLEPTFGVELHSMYEGT